MKNLFFSLSALVLLLNSCSSGSQKEEAKKNFVSTCATAMKRDFGEAPTMQGHIKTYCECSADKIVASFSEAEIRRLDTATDDPILNAKRDEVTAPCREAFIQQAAAGQ